MPVTIISLLVWDSPTYTNILLRNLAALAPGTNCHVRVLDQGSGEETRAMLRRFAVDWPYMSIECLPENIGYSAGHNRNFHQMWKMAKFDYFLTINNDLVFGEAGWLDRLVAAMESNPRVAIGGPFCYKSYENYIAPATRSESEAGDYLFVTGAVAIIRAAAAVDLGLFDEAYSPAYWEDADMVQRYITYGWQQRYIDIPVVHAYLGETERVNHAKREQLLARFGDFSQRNLETYSERWVRGKRPTQAAMLCHSFPGLYFPPA